MILNMKRFWDKKEDGRYIKHIDKIRACINKYYCAGGYTWELSIFNNKTYTQYSIFFATKKEAVKYLKDNYLRRRSNNVCLYSI